MNNTAIRSIIPAICCAAVLAGVSPAPGEKPPPRPCRIRVVEQSSGWPVPLVELSTTHNVRFVTDNAGIVAFDLPELMGRETWFHVDGNGYAVPRDGFGYRGVRLTPEPGGALEIAVARTIVARRIGRLTGGGLFGESRQAGLETPRAETGILGCDSVQNAPYRGKLFWAWGDTNVPRYPLGIFHTTAAFTPPRPLKAFEPPLRLTFDCVTDEKGRPRGVARMPGKGPTWISGVAALPGADEKERLVATYLKIEPPLATCEIGLCVWDDETANFKRHKVLWNKATSSSKPPRVPEGHTVCITDNGKRWILFGDPFPALRCPARFAAWEDPAAWQHLQPQKVVRSAAGGRKITPHRGSIAFSGYRKRWVTVFCESGGKPSFLGELWYAEADAPTGPWGPAVKVLSHDNYTFYNPKLHPGFTPADSPVLLFEGTYTKQFAENPPATPRYDYNQVLYRLDLDDPKLKPAQRAADTTDGRNR